MSEPPPPSIKLAAVNDFKDRFIFGNDLEGLPAVMVDASSAPVRLMALKTKFNELQEKRRSYHKRQGANVGVTVAALGVIGLISGGASAVRQKNRIDDVLEDMKVCLEQINTLRRAFGHIDGWADAEKQCLLDRSAFGDKLDRYLLQGDL